MDVEDKIINGYCCDCDMDPAQCYNAGYCAYEEVNDDEQN